MASQTALAHAMRKTSPASRMRLRFFMASSCNAVLRRTHALRHGAAGTLNMKPERDRAVAWSALVSPRFHFFGCGNSFCTAATILLSRRGSVIPGNPPGYPCSMRKVTSFVEFIVMNVWSGSMTGPANELDENPVQKAPTYTGSPEAITTQAVG